jgi:hypothetical protein
VHAVVLDLLDLDRPERPGAHMQGQLRRFHALRRQLGQHGLIEMQPRRRCGHRPGIAGIHRLVALAIGGLGRAVDVGRQRHLAPGFEALEQRRAGAEIQPEQLGVAPQHLGGERAPGERQDRAR